MSARPRLRSVIWCSLVCALLAPLVARSAEPPPTAEQKILAALDRTVDVDFVKRPLGEVADHFHKLLGMPVVIDRTALKTVGIAPDVPVTSRLAGVRARSALTLILDELSLTWAVRDEALMISTPEQEETLLEPRVYDVSDLVVFGLEGDAVDFDSLIEILSRAIAPVTWDEVGGPGSVDPYRAGGAKAIVVSQTWLIHQQIEQLFASLRAAMRDPAAARKAGSIRIPPYSLQEEAIRRALAQPIDLKFTRTPLDAAVDYLRSARQIEIQFDRRALEDVDIAVDTPITFRRKGLTLRYALQSILRELDLTYTIRDDVLWITTPEEYEAREEIHLYEVTDLVLPPNAPPYEAAGYQGDFDSLINLITSTVRPTTWEGSGPGPLRSLILPGANFLVFRQTADVHEETERLLTTLRRAKRLGNLAKLPSVPISLSVPERSAAETAVREALLKPVNVEVIEEPLDDTLRLIEQQIGAPIVIDRRALDDVAIAPQTHVTENLKGISARSALKLILSEFGLTYVVDGEVLLVTTPEEAECRLVTRLYPVGDLIGSGQPWRPDLSGMDALADTIAAAVAPDTWDFQGGPGSIVPFYGYGADCLVVSQTEAIHNQIEPVLAALRTIHRKHAGLPVPPERPIKEDAILAALRKRIDFEFIETPLVDVVDYLKDVLQIEIQVDKRVLNDVGIGTDEPITIFVKGISGRAALNLVLRPLDLAWVIQDEVLLITTEEEAADRDFETKVYDVTDLVPPDPGPEAVREPAHLGAPIPRRCELPDFLRPADVFDPDVFGAVSFYRSADSAAVILAARRDVREKFEDLLRQLRRVAKEENAHHGGTEDAEK